MIRAKFYTSMDCPADVFDIRRRVFAEELGLKNTGAQDEGDQMAVYALALDADDAPASTGRMHIDGLGHFVIDRVCSLKEARGQGLGDLIMRMLLYRAQELNAAMVFLATPPELVDFFARYGFKVYGALTEEDGAPQRLMRVLATEINLEGTCGGSHACAGCSQNCDTCGEGSQE